MATSPLQRAAAKRFDGLRGWMQEMRLWFRDRPKFLASFAGHSEDSAEARYREFNGRYFADLYEQERMLADKPRMRFYNSAISRHIQPGDRVIDLGTGTGILAALAARRGASKVYAIDHSDILKHAEAIAAHNGVSNVEFSRVHSSEFSLDEKVDVILHEQMGDCLFDEAMVTNIADLRDRLLKPGGRILPSKFELYCEPVKLRDERLVPFIWELNVHGYDYSCMERSRPQHPEYYHRSSSDLGFVDHFLGTPEPALSVDLATLNESDLPLELRFTRTVVNEGRFDGYVVYFRASVDDDLTLGSGPLDANRAPHWGFRFLRTDRDDFEYGDEIEVRLTVERWPDSNSWRWSHVRVPRKALSAPFA